MGSNRCLFLCSRGQPMPVGRNSSNHNSNHNSSGGNMYPPMRSSLPGGATLTPGPPSHRSSVSSGMDGRGGGSAGIHSGRTGSNLTITPSVTITPTSAPAVGSKSRNVSCKVSGRRADKPLFLSQMVGVRWPSGVGFYRLPFKTLVTVAL